eukprot:TRINITY_DN514_c0_g3_i4.p1 TRINITY_DN514_c0_g3~~TRINITY_DN514_c0_g3_i4.p1  ORF type:complete len:416 (-),score=65.07 TRINITY_DN514_c0_g3_i4:1355-2602(-)
MDRSHVTPRPRSQLDGAVNTKEQLRMHESFPIAVPNAAKDPQYDPSFIAVTTFDAAELLSSKAIIRSQSSEQTNTPLSNRDNPVSLRSPATPSNRFKGRPHQPSEYSVKKGLPSTPMRISHSSDRVPSLSESPTKSRPSRTPRDQDDESQYISILQHEQILEERTRSLTKIFQEKLEKQHEVMRKKLEDIMRRFRQQLVDTQNASDERVEALMQKYAEGRDIDTKITDSKNQLKDLKKQVDKHRNEVSNLESEITKLQETQKSWEESTQAKWKDGLSKELQAKNSEIHHLKSMLQSQNALKATQLKHAQEALKKLEDIVEVDLTCTKCLTILAKPITLIPCGHTYCHKCITDQRKPFCEECPQIRNGGSVPNRVVDLMVSRQANRKMYFKVRIFIYFSFCFALLCFFFFPYSFFS